MTITTDAEHGLARGDSAVRWIRSPWIPVAVVFGIAAALRQVVAGNTDVSWLLIAGERMLDGQRLYVDFLETNPPMAVWAYLPGIVIARALGLRPELVTDTLLVGLIAASLGASSRILLTKPARLSRRWGVLIAWIVAVLAILPMHVYGQREHLALVLFLPALAAFMRRAYGAALPGWAIALAGLSAGLTLTFKPYFACAEMACIAAVAWRAQSWRVMFAPENILAGVIVASYGGGFLLLYPEYLTTIYPLVRDVYLPFAMPWPELLVSAATMLWLCAVIAILALRRRRQLDSVLVVTLAASLGFALAFYLQRKGWAYQSYPMIALALIALGYAVATHRGRRFGGLLVAALLFGGGGLWFNATFNVRQIDRAVAAIKPHPKILVLSAEAVIGHPLVRTLDGVWVSRQQAFWVRELVGRLRKQGPVDPQADARLDNYLARERQGLIDDFKMQPPDIVLVDNLTSDWGAWAAEDAELSALLKPYTRSQSIDGIAILSRP